MRAAYGRWEQGDFLSDLSCFDPEFVYEIRKEFPDSGTYAGITEVGTFLQGWLSAWATISMRAIEMVEAGDRIFVAVSQYGTGRSSHIGGELRFFHIWTLRDGLVVRLEAIWEREDALEAAGLAP